MALRVPTDQEVGGSRLPPSASRPTAGSDRDRPRVPRTAADCERSGSLTPIYNRSGRVCGWADADTIRDMRGRVAAFVFGISVVSLYGQPRGWFQGGNFRDPG